MIIVPTFKFIMSTISAKEMDKKLDQKKNRKERNKEKLETSTKIQQPCTKCSESFSSKKKLTNHMINVHDLLRSEVEKVSNESVQRAFKCTWAPLCSKSFSKRKHLNRHIEKIHEDSKSDNNKSVGRNTVANEESHVENHRFGAKQNLPYKNQNPQGPQHQTNQRFDPGLLGGIMPPRFGPPPGLPPSFDKSQPPPGMHNNRSQWRPRPAFSSQSRFASPQNSWNSNWKANWNNPNNPAYRQNFNSQVSTRHVGLV